MFPSIAATSPTFSMTKNSPTSVWINGGTIDAPTFIVTPVTNTHLLQSTDYVVSPSNVWLPTMADAQQEDDPILKQLQSDCLTYQCQAWGSVGLLFALHNPQLPYFPIAQAVCRSITPEARLASPKSEPNANSRSNIFSSPKILYLTSNGSFFKLNKLALHHAS